MWRCVSLACLAIASPGLAQETGPAEQVALAGPRFLAGTAPTARAVDPGSVPMLQRRVTLTAHETTLGEALQAITHQTGVRFLLSQEVVPVRAPVRVEAAGLSLAAALTELLLTSEVDVAVVSESELALVRRRASVADTGAIVGRVVDAKTGAPLDGAEVWLEGTRWRTETDQQGRFRLAEVDSGSYTLGARRIGYAKQSQSVVVRPREEASAELALEPAVTRLQEIVTTVTGDQHRYELGNAIGRIEADSLTANSPITSIGDLINARVAGAQVLLGDGFSGASPRIRLRGLNSFSVSNDPIVILDGTRLQSDPSTRGGAGALPGRLSDLSPDEIESIEVVKGPSAATLYGTDAANGVLVIKTKHGANGHPQFNAYGEVGALSLPGRYQTNWYAWGHAPDGTVMQCTLLALGAHACVQDSISTLNLFNDPSRTPLADGLRQDYGVQVSGGTDALRYFFSGGYQHETGGLELRGAEFQRLDSISGGNVLDEQRRPNGYRRANLRGNVTAQLSPRLRLTLSTGFVDGLTRLPIGSVFSSQVFGLGYVDANGGWSAGDRPSDDFAIRSGEHVSRFTGSFGTNWQIAPWLQSHGTAGVDVSGAFEDGLQVLGQGFPFYPTGHRFAGKVNTTIYSADLGLNASNRVSRALILQTAVGAQYTRNQGTSLSANATGLAPGAQSLTGAALTTTTESTTESVVAGTYLQETVAVHDRLFLTGAVRADGASSFGSNFGVALYPKASGSWLVSEEPFFPRGLGISSLRLRAAYGASGVQPSSVAALQTLQPVTGLVDGVVQSGLVQSALGNVDLKPERQREFEAGADLELFNGRVRLEGTYYHRRSSDALFNATLGPSAGIANQWINLGSVQNQGWEGALDLRVLNSRAVTLDLRANGSINTNKLLSLAPGVTVGVQRQLWSQVVGYPLYGWWDRPLLGFSDANGDGIIEPGEVQVADTAEFIGSTIPTRQLTLGGTIGLFGGLLSITSLMDHRGGYVEPAYSLIYGCLFAANCRAVNDPATPLADQARAVAAIGFNTAPFTVSGAYWRWRELSVTANLPARAAHAVGARALSLTLSGRNLAVWTKFPGVDPEGTINPGSDFSGESLSAPSPRYWLVRVNLGY
jgi:TonB-linked SusC/RagA family outer membrane protein